MCVEADLSIASVVSWSYLFAKQEQVENLDTVEIEEKNVTQYFNFCNLKL